MNRKTQIFAIREVFQFGIGLIIMLSVAVLFSESIEPQVRVFALNRHIDNINSHVDYLISEMVKHSTDGVLSSSFSTSFDMPDKINDYSYRIYFQEGMICTAYNEVPIRNCMNASFPDIDLSGQFLSGGDLAISSVKDSDSVQVFISNS